MKFVLKNPWQQPCLFFSLNANGTFPKLFPAVSCWFTPIVLSVSLPPSTALPKLFPTVSCPFTLSSLPCRSFPTELSPSYFPRFHVRSPRHCFRLAPSQRNFYRAVSHRFALVHPFILLSLSLPTELSQSYFPRFPVRSLSYFSRFPFGSRCRHFHLAPLARQRNLNKNPSLGDAFGKNSRDQIVWKMNLA